MKNTKRTIILSSLIMCLTVVVALVGVSAAWFSDTLRSSNTIIISSETPTGQATIDIESASTRYFGGDKLVPAIINKDFIQQDNSGAGTGSVPYDAINVLSPSLIGNTSAAPLVSNATTFSVYFPFMYVGSSDVGTADGLKSVEVHMKSASLLNPREKDEEGNPINTDYVNYMEDFNFSYSVVKVVLDEDKKVVSDQPNTDIALPEITKIRNGDAYDVIYMIIKPGVEYYFKTVINFSKVDEFCNQELLDTRLYFNFDITAVRRRGA